MSPITIENSNELGTAIKNRRIELNLTIEEAALKAGIGTKTWSRYESGGAIRRDKVRGLCKVLKWKSIPGVESNDTIKKVSVDEYREYETWSSYIEENFGEHAALSFVIGSDLLLDAINSDLAALSEMPRGTHIGEIPYSSILPSMPEQFLMRYDYEFLWYLRKTLIRFRKIAQFGNTFIASSVIEELVLYLIVDESRFLMEEMLNDLGVSNDDGENAKWDDWIFYIFEGMDLLTCLYSDLFILTPNDTYHFDNWLDEQFWVTS